MQFDVHWGGLPSPTDPPHAPRKHPTNNPLSPQATWPMKWPHLPSAAGIWWHLVASGGVWGRLVGPWGGLQPSTQAVPTGPALASTPPCNQHMPRMQAGPPHLSHLAVIREGGGGWRCTRPPGPTTRHAHEHCGHCAGQHAQILPQDHLHDQSAAASSRPVHAK